jgi:AcrR family transcriptional regulator
MEIAENKKCGQLLATAKVLFWKHGFKRVSVEEICKVAKVSKMTFYKFFSNKAELAKAVIDRVLDEGKQNFKNIMHDDSSPSEKMKKILLLKYEGTHDISQEFLQDFYSNPEIGLKTYVESKSREAWIEMLDDFRNGQEQGWLRKDFKPEFLFFLSQKLNEMVTDKNLLKLYGSPQELIMEMTNMITYGISPRDLT